MTNINQFKNFRLFSLVAYSQIIIKILFYLSLQLFCAHSIAQTTLENNINQASADTQNSSIPLARQYEIQGDKFVSKSNYKKAIEAYKKSIQLQPDKNLEKRIKRLQAYLGITNSSLSGGERIFALPHSITINKPQALSDHSPALPPEYTKKIKTTEIQQQFNSMISPALLENMAVTKADLKPMENFIDTGTITTTISLLKQLYGKLTPEQKQILEKQFDAYYQYPSDEVIKQFQVLNKILYQAIELKTRLSIELQQFGHTAAEAMNASDFNNPSMMIQASSRLSAHQKNILAIQRQINEVNMHLNNLDDLADAEAIKKQHEKQFEELIRRSAGASLKKDTLSTESASIDGLWELNRDEPVSFIYSADNLSYENKPIKDIPETQRDFMGFFRSNKIYLKTIHTMQNGYSLIYLYKEHEYNNSLFGDEVSAAISKSLDEAFGGKTSTGKFDDTFERFIMQQVAKDKYILFWNDDHDTLTWKISLSVKGRTLQFEYEKLPSPYMHGEGRATLARFQFHKLNTPSSPPTLKNGAWNWSEMSEDFQYEIQAYKALSKAAKEKEYQQLDLDNVDEIQQKIALFKHNKNIFAQEVSLFKGEIPSLIKEDNLVWKLDSVKVKNAFISDDDYSVSLAKGHIKIWRWVLIKKEETHNDNGMTHYIPPIDRESSNISQKKLVATFTWLVPDKVYDEGTDWKVNLQVSTAIPSSWKAVTSERYRIGSNTDSGVKVMVIPEKPLSSHSIQMSKKSLSENDGHILLQAQLLDNKEGIDFNPEITISYHFKLLTKDSLGKPGVQGNIETEVSELMDKQDFYKLQIEQLTEDLNRYKEMMITATAIKQKKSIALLMMGKEADIQQQKDLLAELTSGEFHHTKTRWDKHNADITRSRFLQQEKDYQSKLKIIADMRKLTAYLRKSGSGQYRIKNWGQNKFAQAAKSGDYNKMQKVFFQVRKLSMNNLEKDQAYAEVNVIEKDDMLERALWVKGIAEAGILVGSMGLSSGGTLIYAGYAGLTDGISDGINAGIKKAVTSLNMGTMIAGSAYDGYQTIDPKTGKKQGFKGAATHALTTAAIMGTLHITVTGIVKSAGIAKAAYQESRLVDSAIQAQERKMSKILINQYEEKIANYKKLLKSGNKVAASQELAKIEQETMKLMANPHAKNILKYQGGTTTQRYYQYSERKIQAKIKQAFIKKMEEKGWSKFKLQEFRNASSGKTVGMDWDVGLVESQLETRWVNGQASKVIKKNGQYFTVKQWQKEAEKEFQKVYYKQTGYSAEGSFANITSSAHKEAFKDLTVLTNPAAASKELADNTARTIKYKADVMIKSHSGGFISKTGKLGEASRGMAKEIRTKLIPNIQQSKNSSEFLLDKASGVDYFNRLEKLLREFGENKISITEAERGVKNLTGKSLTELPVFISTSLKRAIKAK